MQQPLSFVSVDPSYLIKTQLVKFSSLATTFPPTTSRFLNAFLHRSRFAALFRGAFFSTSHRKRARTISPPNSVRHSAGVLLSMHKYPPRALNFAVADFCRALMHLRFVPGLFRCKPEMGANTRGVINWFCKVKRFALSSRENLMYGSSMLRG